MIFDYSFYFDTFESIFGDIFNSFNLKYSTLVYTINILITLPIKASIKRI